MRNGCFKRVLIGMGALVLALSPVKTPPSWIQPAVKVEAASGITINRKNVKILKGKSIALITNWSEKENIKWSTSNEKVATVTGRGLHDKNCTVKAMDTGTVIITGRTGTNEKVTCKVTVYEGKLSKTDFNLDIGKTTTLRFSGGSGKEKWKVSNKKVVLKKVSAHKYKITGIKAGNANVIVKDGGNTYKCKVVVKKPGKMQITKAKKIKGVNFNETISFKVNNPNNFKLTWNVSNNDVLKVMSESNMKCSVKGTMVGTSVVEAYCSDMNKKWVWEVSVKAVSKPYFTQNPITLTVGETIDAPLAGVKTSVMPKYSADDIGKVILLTLSGKIKARTAGTAIVTALADGQIVSLEVIVVQKKGTQDTANTMPDEKETERQSEQTEKQTEQTEKQTEKQTETPHETETDKKEEMEKQTESETEKETEQLTETEKNYELVLEKSYISSITAESYEYGLANGHDCIALYMKYGKPLELSAYLNGPDGYKVYENEICNNIEWKSSDTSVFTVKSAGTTEAVDGRNGYRATAKVLPVSCGEAVLECWVNGSEHPAYSMPVKVSEYYEMSKNIENSYSMLYGEVQEFKIGEIWNPEKEEINSCNVDYVIDRESIAEISMTDADIDIYDKEVKLLAKGAGTAMLTITDIKTAYDVVRYTLTYKIKIEVKGIESNRSPYTYEFRKVNLYDNYNDETLGGLLTTKSIDASGFAQSEGHDWLELQTGTLAVVWIKTNNPDKGSLSFFTNGREIAPVYKDGWKYRESYPDVRYKNASTGELEQGGYLYAFYTHGMDIGINTIYVHETSDSGRNFVGSFDLEIKDGKKAFTEWADDVISFTESKMRDMDFYINEYGAECASEIRKWNKLQIMAIILSNRRYYTELRNSKYAFRYNTIKNINERYETWGLLLQDVGAFWQTKEMACELSSMLMLYFADRLGIKNACTVRDSSQHMYVVTEGYEEKEDGIWRKKCDWDELLRNIDFYKKDSVFEIDACPDGRSGILSNLTYNYIL